MQLRRSPYSKCARAFLIGGAMSGILIAQNDPGPRGGAAGAGSYYSTLNADEQSYFQQALAVFIKTDSVKGQLPNEPGGGLGPTFNGNSCVQCHTEPAAGGSSPGLKSRINPVPNPQVALATLDGAKNTVPSFITSDGPVREARFISDGGVHGLYTIAGRTDAPGCTLAQPNFAQQLAGKNVIFRIPTPLFGLGLVENTPDATLQASFAATQSARSASGIGGRFNTTGNDGTITRFGWKAQNKSLMVFSGEAYNVEVGVSNEVFPNERSATPGCIFNPTPEDYTNIVDPSNPNLTTGTASRMSSDVTNFAAFERLLAAPTPTTASQSEQNGQALFASVGCALCHTQSLTSANSIFTGMSNVTYHPYSDFALHHMGANLADGIGQGIAVADEFRTAPLWGLGQRLFFLHDGRSTDLMDAIGQHMSTLSDCSGKLLSFLNPANGNCLSEANVVILRFNALPTAQKQSILDFLRSL